MISDYVLADIERYKAEVFAAYPSAKFLPSSGGYRVNVCPVCGLHETKRDSSSLRGDKGKARLHCFRCGLTYDLLDFIQKTRGCSFREARAYLGGDCKRPLRLTAPKPQRKPAVAVPWFADWFKEGWCGGGVPLPVWQYLKHQDFLGLPWYGHCAAAIGGYLTLIARASIGAKLFRSSGFVVSVVRYELAQALTAHVFRLFDKSGAILVLNDGSSTAYEVEENVCGRFKYEAKVVHFPPLYGDEQLLKLWDAIKGMLMRSVPWPEKLDLFLDRVSWADYPWLENA